MSLFGIQNNKCFRPIIKIKGRHSFNSIAAGESETFSIDLTPYTNYFPANEYPIITVTQVLGLSDTYNPDITFSAYIDLNNATANIVCHNNTGGRIDTRTIAYAVY